jgi:hypothetical protein
VELSDVVVEHPDAQTPGGLSSEEHAVPLECLMHPDAQHARRCRGGWSAALGTVERLARHSHRRPRARRPWRADEDRLNPVSPTRMRQLIIDALPYDLCDHQSRAPSRSWCFVEVLNGRLFVQFMQHIATKTPDPLRATAAYVRAIRPSNCADVMAGARSHLCRRQREMKIIRNLFEEKHVRYGA